MVGSIPENDSATATTKRGGGDSKPAATKPPKNVEFRGSGSVSEGHKNHIYGLSWSDDIFVVNVSDEAPAEQPITMSRNHFYRCLASCAGRQVSVYDVEIPDPKAKGRPPKTGDFNLVQFYEDPDPTEAYYACAFGGRSLGGPFGFHPVSKPRSTTNCNRGGVSDGKEPTNDKQLEKKTQHADTNAVPNINNHNRSSCPAKSNQCGEGDNPSRDQINSTSTTGGINKDAEDGGPQQKRAKTNTSYATNAVESAQPDESAKPLETPEKQELIRQLLDSESHDGPQLLCVAGVCKSIKVIDTVRRMVFMTLAGHGDEVEDLKFCPVDEWLLLSASKDKSVRLWNLKSGTSVGVFAGCEGHKNGVLSVAWHCTGTKIASTGYDYRIKIWDIGPGTKVYDNVKKSHKARLRKLDNNTFAAFEYFKPIICQFPIFSTNSLHLHAVDCVQFIGDIMLSKSTDKIIMWVIDETEERNPKVVVPPPSKPIALHAFDYPNPVNTYFFRFGTDPLGQVLTVGTWLGDVLVYKIGQRSSKHFCKLATPHKGQIRNTVWSPDGKILLASTDKGELYKWDVIEK